MKPGWADWAAMCAMGLVVVGLTAGCLPIGGSASVKAAPTARPPSVPALTPTPCDKCGRDRPQRPTATPTPARAIGLNVGAQAPDFGLPTLQGPAARLGDCRGRVVLLNFWATWCGYCRLEMPTLAAAFERYSGRGFTVLAVNILEPRTLVEAFARDYSMPFPVLLDSEGAVGRLYRIRLYPTTFVIDREGVVRNVHPGLLDEHTLRTLVEPLLGV